jgi:hypothetical protein
MDRKNVLIGKIGKSIKFKNLHINTGDDTGMILFSTMSRMIPEWNFYFCGPNDLSKLTQAEYDYLFPNHNVHSVFVKARQIPGYPPGTVTHDPTVENIVNNGIHIDFAIMFTGYVGATCLSNVIRKRDGEYRLSLQAFKNYVGAYVHVLNCLQCPLYTIAEDPRYITVNAKELFNRERLVFTQMPDTSIRTHESFIVSYDDYVKTGNCITKDIKCTYGGVEKIFLMAIDTAWREHIDIERKLKNTRNPKCIVLSNGHGTANINGGNTIQDGRLSGYKQYIIDGLAGSRYDDTKIYGKWSDEALSTYPQIIDKKIIELDDEIADAKYTFIYSIIPGFVTIKPYEMIIKGLLPFIHPEYDCNHLLGLPEYLYVKDPQDFKAKMMELDNDDELYKKLLNECFDAIKPEYIDGTYVINNMLKRMADDCGFEYEPHKGVKPILNHFAKDIFDYNKLQATDKKNQQLDLF